MDAPDICCHNRFPRSEEEEEEHQMEIREMLPGQPLSFGAQGQGRPGPIIHYWLDITKSVATAWTARQFVRKPFRPNCLGTVLSSPLHAVRSVHSTLLYIAHV